MPAAADPLAALLALAPDPTAIVDRDGRIAALDARVAELVGRAPDALAGQPFELLLPQGLLDPNERLVVRHADGRDIPVEISVRVLDGAEPLPAVAGPALAVAIRDATLRRRRAAALREAGERFRRLFEDGPVAMALIGEDFHLGEVNEAYCELTGYSAAELRELTFSDITHPDDVEVGVRLVRRMFAGEIPGFSMDKRYVRKDRETLWIQLTVSMIRDEDGTPLKGLGVMQDITERRAALTRAREQLDRLERDRDRILASAGEGIYHVGDDGRITFANPAAATMLGWPLDALIGKPAHDLLHHTRADGTHVARGDCPIHRSAPGRTTEHVTGDVFWRRDGGSFPVDCTSAPVREPGVGGAVVVFTDVSERVRMEAALRDASASAARARVQAAESERARWARELHDETLQSLAGLHVLLSSGVRAPDTEAMRERIALAQEQIEGAMENLRGLISDLRPAALDELGLEASVRDLAERVEVVYGLDVETSVALHGDDGAPLRLASEVETTAYRIVQECLSNAARHAGATRVGVGVEITAPRDALRVRVRDDGCGFDAAAGDGGGYGLRSMRERVDLLDGELTLASAAGSGTEIVAVLPLA